MILEDNDAPGHLELASRHLSYGERNAFALVLFMHHVRRDKPDLVVLDDPVSSFDKTKKFAILHKLFQGKDSIRGFTTLFLTHDIEPAIDVVRTGTSRQFQASEPVAHFLRSRKGMVDEKPIEPDDIKTFLEVCNSNVRAADDDGIKCIYLRRRYEIEGQKGDVYEVLSSLLHLRDVPERKQKDGVRIELSADETEAATAEIRRWIPSFDYGALLEELRDVAVLRAKFESTDVGYEKVQLFRIALELGLAPESRDAAFRKFVNETYHIENEYLMQLNPRDFDAVPEHVVAACSELLDEMVEAA